MEEDPGPSAPGTDSITFSITGSVGSPSIQDSGRTSQNDSTKPTSGVDTSSITTLSASSALFDILTSVVAAASLENPTHQSLDLGEGTSTSAQPPIQLQLQLNPQQLLTTTENSTGEATKEVTRGRGRGRKSSGIGRGKGKDKQSWHYHLGGVRHCRVPISPEIKEALEVAYVSRIMSKNFRKEGQPEKERISRITGLELEKVHEWFKNRRKKDKLLQSRSVNMNFQRSKRGRKPILPHVIPPPTTSAAATTLPNEQEGIKWIS